MKPEKALCDEHSKAKLYCSACVKDLNADFQEAFDKKLGRLKLVEEMMTHNAADCAPSLQALIGNAVVYKQDDFTTMLSELQAVIAEIEGDMAFTYEAKKEMSE